MDTMQIAKVCHEANRAYCESIGDFTQRSWETCEHWQRDSAVAGVQWRIDHPHAPTSQQHDAWVEDKERNEKSGLRKYKNKAGKTVEVPHTYTAIDAILGSANGGGKSVKPGGSKKPVSVDAEAEAILKELVEAGGLTTKNIALFGAKRLMKLKQTDQPKAEAIKAKLLDSDFRDGLDWLTTDKKGALSVTE